MPESPRAVVLDLGNVLIFFDHRRAASALVGHGLTSTDAFLAGAYGSPQERDLDAGRMSPDAYSDWAISQFGLTCGRDVFAGLFADVFSPNAPMLALARSLRGLVPLALASNTNALHRPAWERVLAEHGVGFDVEVTSDRVGFRKPEPGFYAAVQAALGLADPAEVWFFDDLPANVEAARAFGWRAWVYEPGGEAERVLGDFVAAKKMGLTSGGAIP